jgi:hypothetical protein
LRYDEIILKNDSNEKIRNDGALTTQQAFIIPESNERYGELLVSDIRFTKEVCATLGTNYDVLKGKSNSFKI